MEKKKNARADPADGRTTCNAATAETRARRTERYPCTLCGPRGNGSGRLVSETQGGKKEEEEEEEEEFFIYIFE